jgi:hypothetical protein
MRQALQRRQTVRYALPREVDLHMASTRVMLSHWKSGVPVPGELVASFANLSKPLKGT